MRLIVLRDASSLFFTQTTHISTLRAFVLIVVLDTDLFLRGRVSVVKAFRGLFAHRTRLCESTVVARACVSVQHRAPCMLAW